MPPKRAGGRPHTTAARLAPQRSGKPLPGTYLETIVSLPSGPRRQEDNSSPNRLILERAP